MMGPDFEAIMGKRMSEMTDAQREDAHELWLRENYGWFVAGDVARHLKFLIDRLDEARRSPAPLSEDAPREQAQEPASDVPYPGMAEAFESYYSQSFTDKDWRRESGVWAAAWKAALRGTAPREQAQGSWEGQIRPEDLRIDTFSIRQGGFVMRPDSGVRITHIPTGLTAECSDERSQHRNRHNAYEALVKKLKGGAK